MLQSSYNTRVSFSTASAINHLPIPIICSFVRIKKEALLLSLDLTEHRSQRELLRSERSLFEPMVLKPYAKELIHVLIARIL